MHVIMDYLQAGMHNILEKHWQYSINLYVLKYY